MSRSQVAVSAGLLVVAVVVLAVLATRAPDVAAPSPSPSSPSPTLTATATGTAAPTALPSPSPTPQGLYTSKKLGYALELTPPWHKAICGDIDPVADQTPAVQQVSEQFTSAGPMEELIGDVGSANDRIDVALIENPERRSMRDIDQAVFFGPSTSVKDVTFAGRPAVEVSNSSPGGEQLFYFVADGDRYYRIGYQTFRPASEPPPDLPTMQRIVRSFRFLSDAERQALPDPTPIPAAAATPQALAGLLKTAFDRKDVAALEHLLGPCVSQGFEQAGVGRVTREKFVADLRTQFANGLVVTVDTNAVQIEASIWGTWVRSRWNALPPSGLRPPATPGQETRTVELVMGRTTGGYYWRGTIVTRDPS
jgi:hypothetical protein